MIDPNAPAYPNARAYACGPIDGMTIRATMAMHVDITAYDPIGTFKGNHARYPTINELAEYIAFIRVREADALIAELNKEKP